MTLKLKKMKSNTYIQECFLRVAGLSLLLGISMIAPAQSTDSVSNETTEEVVAVKKAKPVKNTFESIWLIDNQTVMVPIKKTFEMDILHRFGTMGNGYKDFYGLFASSNIKLGFNYVPVDNLLVGVSLAKSFMTVEGFAKYALLKQTRGKYPVSLSYYVNAAWDSRPGDNYIHSSDEWMFFHQLMIARKVTEKLSVQVAPSVTHVNYVNGYFKTIKTETGTDSSVVAGERKHEHFAVAFMGRYKLTQGMALIVNYDQPITKHLTGNPKPNISLGLEVATSAHAFQFFIGNYYHLSPQRNNYFNQNSYKEGSPFESGNQFLIGFNITRLWNY
jgi:hypothetical protein